MSEDSSSSHRHLEEEEPLDVRGPVRKNSSIDSYDVAAEDLEDFQDNESEEEPLTWRMDSQESLSDWTIVVSSLHSCACETYNVHRNILAVGRSKSDYFASLFRNASRLKESDTNTSRITMEDEAAKVFPSLLDFMYSPQNAIEITTDKAVALRYLAQYFGVRLLRSKVNEFVRTDMKLETVSTYIQDALIFHDERLLSMAADTCVRNIRNMNKSSPLLKSIDPSFFMRILSSTEIDTCDESSDISILVAAYCNHHQDELDVEEFDQLTSKAHMPLIHRTAALLLLQLEAAIRKTCESSPPSCLQKRCIKVLAHSWENLTQGQNLGGASLKELPSPMLAELLDKCLAAASHSATFKDYQHKLNMAKVRDSCEEKLTTIQNDQKASDDAIKKLEKEANEKIAKLRAAVAERDRQMLEYEKELGKFVRVPVTHRFQSVERDTYHHLSGNEPFDTARTNHDRYGRTRPTAIPQYADNTENGFLYTEKKGTSLIRWPIYYYKDE